MRLKTSEIFGRDLEQESAVLSSDWRRRRKIISAVDKFRWSSPLAVGGATSWELVGTLEKGRSQIILFKC